MEGLNVIPGDILKLIPIYSGGKRELNLFLRKCEYVINIYRGNDEQNLYMYHAITSRLAGNAAELLSERDDIMSWAELRTLLIQHFGEPRSEECLAIEMEAMKIKQGESFLDFCNRVQSVRSMLISKVNQLLDPNIKSSKLIIYNNLSLNVFLYNLPENLVRLVRLKNPATLEHALAIVLEEVNFEEQYRIRSKMTNMTNAKPTPLNGPNNFGGSQQFKFGIPQNFGNPNFRNAPMFRNGLPPNRQQSNFQNRFGGPRPHNFNGFGQRPSQFGNQQMQSGNPQNQFANRQPGYRPPQYGNGYRPSQFGYKPPQFGYRSPQFGQRPMVNQNGQPQFRQDTSGDISMRTANNHHVSHQLNELYGNDQVEHTPQYCEYYDNYYPYDYYPYYEDQYYPDYVEPTIDSDNYETDPENQTRAEQNTEHDSQNFQIAASYKPTPK